MKTNIKLRVTPEQSEAVQKICFANGIKWKQTNFNRSTTGVRYIFINQFDLTKCPLTSASYFEAHSYSEVDADLFIRTNGTCEEFITQQELDDMLNNKSKEDMFKQYGFEVPNFDCELLGIVSGPYKKDKFVVGTIKKGIFNNCPHMWSIKYGTCYTSSIASNMYDYNLTPIKQPWYETCKFPVLVWDEDNNLLALRTRGEYTASYLGICKPL